jgi:hypothetical protein
MSTAQHPATCGEVISGWWRRDRTTRLLLWAAIPAAVVYVLGDLLAGLRYNTYGSYSFRDQAISELSAFGSPVRPLMVTVILVHGMFLCAFGIGILRVAQRRSVRWIGGLLVAQFLIVGLWNHTFGAMTSRAFEAGASDTVHIVLTSVFGLGVAAMMVLSAVAYSGAFRLYASTTLAVVAAFGVASSIAMSGLEQNDTPWAGAFERVNAYAYLAWLVVLAVTVARREHRPIETTSERPAEAARMEAAA